VTWRSVTVYWMLAALVGGRLAFTMGERADVEAPAEPHAAPIVAVQADTIDAVRATTRAGSLELRRQAGRWRVERPAGAVVSSDLVRAFVDTLTTVEPIEVLNETPEHLAAYGLEPPASTLEFGAEGRTLATIHLGTRNPTRTAVYGRRDDAARVYLLGLNAQYYLDLLYEQAGAAGAAAGESRG
jgi:hypothetical protein